MVWIEIKVETLAKNLAEITQLFTDLGALAATTQDAGNQPLYEPDLDTTPLWDNVVVTGLFEEHAPLEQILLTLYIHYPHLKFEVQQLADQEWERAWIKDFQPMSFGKRLWIVPSHHNVTLSANQVVLDPGLAFGTGKHPTTALCLSWLDDNIKGNETVIDYGCGSGILAIAALKLGAKKVFAIDHDPQAILATQENAKNNALSDQQIITLYPHEYHQQAADIIIANILANPLIALAPQFAAILPANGKVVLSGILDYQAPEVIAAYESFFKVGAIVQLEEWVRIEMSPSRTTGPCKKY